MAISTEKLPDLIKANIIKITENFMRSDFSSNIKKIIVFGSFATGKYQPDSDIDIAVVLGEIPPRTRLAEYRLLADGIGRETDLLFCTEEQLLSRRYVYAEILREGVTVYENL